MTAIDLAFQTYLDALRKTPIDQKTEHTDRTPLETLLNTLAALTDHPDTHVQHEPKRRDDKGSPDFKVTTGANAILGYVEVKTINADLDRVLKSDQITKYKSLSQNIVLTDYLHFIWINGTNIERHSLAFASDLENPKHKINPTNAAAVAAIFAGFFSIAPAGIARAQELALALATRAHLLRDGLTVELLRQEAQHQQGRLYGLLGAFRTQVFHDLTLVEFADAFAQMLAYGLFLARLNTTENLTLTNARNFIPAAFPLIRELINFTAELNEPDYAQIRWIVEEILSIMNSLDMIAIRQDLSFANRKATMRKVRAGSEEEHRLFERDPFVYFYEDFLAKYDAKLRKSRGVYYTPPPVVNFIIRAIDDILKSEFNIPTGLADHKRVTLLDFATGTGTFLLEAFERMFETIGEGKRDLLVREHILKNVFGFEYLIAPYTIAHLKLSQYLADKGHKLAGNERLQIYLTNTLEPIEPQINYLLPALSEEAKKAQTIKDQPILVITGNPPYSGFSKNTGPVAARLAEPYKIVDGMPFGEKRHWLNDDYVKFIRFAQEKIDSVPHGIVGVITNHSFLDNPTFRGMRQSLMASFDKIFLLDLHGNAKRKEKAPDGSKDENVFDIEQGVSISFFIKTKNPIGRDVWRADLWGSRLSKYETCSQVEYQSMPWTKLSPTSPWYFFVLQSGDGRSGYDAAPSIKEIFPINVTGIITARDHLAIDFVDQELLAKVVEFSNPALQPLEVVERFGVKDTRGWKVDEARKKIAADDSWKSNIKTVSYRPFDDRKVIFDNRLVDWGRWDLMRHLTQDNLCIGVGRAGSAVSDRPWELVTAFKNIFDANLFRRGLVAGFPLYVYNRHVDGTFASNGLFDRELTKIGQRSDNIAPAFRADLAARYGAPSLTPEQIFGYIYAILHAPTYRTRYAEFLRGDFPRIPLAATRAAFEALSTLGWDLAQKHLLKSVPANPVSYRGKGDNTVEKPRYAETEQAVYINATQSFAPVPEAVWNFHIGGYQVIEKYLKSRKGRTLTLDEVTNVENIVAVLAFTISQMQIIDAAYRAAFPVSQ